MVVALAYDERDDATAEKIDRGTDAFQKPIQKSASKIEAWKRFCEEIGVPAEVPEVLGGGDRLAAPMAIAKDIASEFGDCEPDGQMVDSEMEALRDYWSSLIAKVN